MKKKIYKVGGLFSGVGGIESGFNLKDKFEIKWASDLDKYSARTYRKNYTHTFIEKDINNLKGSELDEVEALQAIHLTWKQHHPGGCWRRAMLFPCYLF